MDSYLSETIPRLNKLMTYRMRLYKVDSWENIIV